MPFHKWPSIVNTYREENILWWTERFPDLTHEQYIILEKLHGRNLSWAFDPDGTVQPFSRYGSLKAKGFGSGNITALKTTHALVLDRFRELALASGSAYNLFGELFGPKMGKGVKYGDERRVLYFGLMIDGELQPPCIFLDLMNEDEVTPILGIVDGLEAALAFDPNLDSRVLGISDNVCEGIVIQPLNKVYKIQDTFILKKKNEAFKERERAPKVRVADPEVETLNADFSAYITENRMQSAFSKHGPIESRRQIGHYILLILNDAKEDFLGDCPDVNSLEKTRRRAVFNVGSKIAHMLQAHMDKE